MLTLTSAITVPNIQKIHVDAVQLDSNTNIGTVTCSVQGAGGLVYSVPTVVVRDGSSQGIRATVSPLGYFDRVENFTTTTATGFTDLVTAYGTAGNVTVKNKAAESALLAAGLLPPGTVA